MYKPDKSLELTGQNPTLTRTAPPTPTVKGKKLTLNNNQKEDSSGDSTTTGITMARRVQEEGNRGSNNPLANKREDAHRRAEQKAQAWQNESERPL